MLRTYTRLRNGEELLFWILHKIMQIITEWCRCLYSPALPWTERDVLHDDVARFIQQRNHHVWIAERCQYQGRIQEFLKEGAQSALKWLLNVHFSHFLINLLQIFHKRGGGGAAPSPNPPLSIFIRLFCCELRRLLRPSLDIVLSPHRTQFYLGKARLRFRLCTQLI